MASIAGKFLKRAVVGFLLLLFIFVGTIFGLMFFGVTIDLGFLKEGVEASAQSVLGREVTIEGPVAFEFSTWPAIDVQGVQVANVASSLVPVFLSAERARLQVGIFPLLKGNIEIADIFAEDIVLNLENSNEGSPNWEFGSGGEQQATKKPKQSADKEKTTSENVEPFFSLSGINNLSFKNIAVKYHDAALNKTLEFNLENMQGRGAPGAPLSLSLKGDVQNKPYAFKFNGDSLVQLFTSGERTWQFAIEGDAVGKRITADGSFVKGKTESQANLGFAIDDIDIGLILSALGLVEGLEASTRSMGATLTLKGDSLNEIVQKSSMTFSVRDGKWNIVSPTSDAFIEVSDLTGDIMAEQGNPVTMKLVGMVDRRPVNFVITGAPLVDYVIGKESIPLTIDAEFASSILSIGGKLALPITNRDLSLFFKFKTNSLTHLSDVLGVELPPVGPINFMTKFQLSGKTYKMPEFDLQVGGSHLAGNMILDTSGAKPQVDIELISKLIQLDDFEGLSQVLPDTKKDVTGEPEDAGQDDKEADKQSDQPTSEQKIKLLSREVLSSFDSSILLQTEQVLSGKDSVGSATLRISVEDSLLSVDPLQIDIPGGGVAVNLDYLPGDDGVKVNLSADIEDFDIGVLVRRSKPDSDMGGMLFLHAALHSQSPDLPSIMEYADGHFDFGVVPKNFSAGIIDLWAVNLISAIMTEVSEEEKSEINCVVVRFGMEDGLMAEKAIYMDTSNMRIAGKADVDFKNRTFKIILAPKAKYPEFFSLAVPIKVDGTFEDFNFGIELTRLTGAVFSFITSPVHVPIRRVFTDKISEDGEEACRKAWEITEESTPANQ